MFEAYRVGVSLNLLNNLSPGLRDASREVDRLKRGTADLSQGFNSAKVAATGFVAILAGAAMAGAIAQVARLGRELVQQEAMLRAAGYTAEEVARSSARAWEITGQVRGTTASSNLRIINEGRTTFGSLEAAERFAPSVARFSRVLTATGVRDADREANYHARSIELRGRANPNRPEEFEAEMNRAAASQIAFGGRVKGQDMANFMQRAGLAGRMMDSDAFYSFVPSLIQATGGGDTAGTMVAALFRQMVGGVMTRQQANRLGDAGILERNAPQRRLTRDEFNRRRDRGEFDRNDQFENFRDQVVVSPRALVDSELFARDPSAWAARHLTGENGAFARLAQQRGGRELNDAEKAEWIAQAFGTETARRLVGILTFNRDNIDKDREAAERARAGGPQAINNLLNESPDLAYDNLIKSFRSIGEAFSSSAMRSSVPLMNQLSDSMSAFARTINENPLLATRVMIGASAVAGILLVGGAIALVGATLAFIGAPILLFVAALAAGYALYSQMDWATHWNNFLVGLSFLWDNVQAFGQMIFDWVGSSFTATLSTIAGVLNWFAGIVQQFMSMIPNIAGTVGNVAGSVGSGIRDGASWLTGGLIAPSARGTPSATPVPGSGLPAGAPPPPPAPQPIVVQNNMTLDGRVVHRSVTQRMADQASAPNSGRTGFDPRRTGLTPGAAPAN